MVHPLLDAAKRMLHYFTALPQDFRIRFQPRFHPIQHLFIDIHVVLCIVMEFLLAKESLSSRIGVGSEAVIYVLGPN